MSMTTQEAIKTLTSPGIKKGTPREYFDELMSATEAIGIVLRAAEENTLLKKKLEEIIARPRLCDDGRQTFRDGFYHGSKETAQYLLDEAAKERQ